MKCEKKTPITILSKIDDVISVQKCCTTKQTLEFIPKLSTMFLPEFLKKMKECVIASVHNNTYLAMHS